MFTESCSLLFVAALEIIARKYTHPHHRAGIVLELRMHSVQRDKGLFCTESIPLTDPPVISSLRYDINFLEVLECVLFSPMGRDSASLNKAFE